MWGGGGEGGKGNYVYVGNCHGPSLGEVEWGVSRLVRRTIPLFLQSLLL